MGSIRLMQRLNEIIREKIDKKCLATCTIYVALLFGVVN